MSVVRQLVHISAVEALRGRTIAGGAVYDSRIVGFADLLKGERRAALNVSVESARQDKGDQGERALLGRPTTMTMVVQIAVAQGREAQTDDGQTIVVGEVGETDAACEALLNILDRQWRQILAADASDWADVWRGLSTSIDRISDARVVNPENGGRYAARVTEISMNVIPEPAVGVNGVVARGLELMEETDDASYREIARVYRALLAEGETLEDPGEAGVLLAGDKTLLPALGLGTILEDDGQALPAIAAATIAVDGLGATEVSS